LENWPTIKSVVCVSQRMLNSQMKYGICYSDYAN